MGLQFNESELNLAEKIIYIGMAKASESFAFFTKEKVSISSLGLNIKDVSALDSFTKRNLNEQLAVLTTHLVGELTGVCFLMLSESDCKKIEEICISPKYRSDIINSLEMIDALLLEMDNIIAGSVITQFSNIFKFKVHGDVPGLKRVKVSELSSAIKNEFKSTTYMLYFKCNFSTNNMIINPEFVWLLDDNFIHGVKKIASDENEIESVNRFHSTINDQRRN